MNASPSCGRVRTGRAGCLVLLLALAVPAPPALPEPGAGATGPSFDCRRARAPAERTVCRSPALARLDRELDRAWTAASRSLDPAQYGCLRADQRAWLGARDACTSPACLEQAYRRRLVELRGLLPGIAGDGRPGGPGVAESGAPLLAILAPAEDAGASNGQPRDPATLEGIPLEDEGGYLLVDEAFDHAAWQALADLQGDEAALQARFGDGPIVLPGMVGAFPSGGLDPRGRAAIDAAVARRERLRVRGTLAATDGQAPPQFDGAYCVFIHAAASP